MADTVTRKRASGTRAAPKRRRRKKKKGPAFRTLIPILLVVVIVGVLVNLGQRVISREVPSWVDVQIVDINGAGRRGTAIGTVKDIAIHYVGNPGTTAQQNRDFFNQPDTTVSAHFLIGLEGEIIQCIPLDEMSSATNDRNGDTISIEVCHPDDTGEFTDATYQSLVKLTAWLCDNYHLSRDHVIRHYDVTGKLCPLYFVEHEDAWEQFLADVKGY
jgi:hypothetical protein